MENQEIDGRQFLHRARTSVWRGNIFDRYADEHCLSYSKGQVVTLCRRWNVVVLDVPVMVHH